MLFYFLHVRTSSGSDRNPPTGLWQSQRKNFPSCFRLCLLSHMVCNQLSDHGMLAPEDQKALSSQCPSSIPTGLPQTVPGPTQCHLVWSWPWWTYMEREKREKRAREKAPGLGPAGSCRQGVIYWRSTLACAPLKSSTSIIAQVTWASSSPKSETAQSSQKQHRGHPIASSPTCIL